MENPGRTTSPGADGAAVAGRGDGAFNADVHNKIDQAANAARPIVDRVAASAHGAVDNAAHAAAHAAETIGAKGDQLKDVQAQATDSVLAYMRSKPYTSLGIAVAMGFLLSKLIGSGAR